MPEALHGHLDSRGSSGASMDRAKMATELFYRARRRRWQGVRDSLSCSPARHASLRGAAFRRPCSIIPGQAQLLLDHGQVGACSFGGESASWERDLQQVCDKRVAAVQRREAPEDLRPLGSGFRRWQRSQCLQGAGESRSSRLGLRQLSEGFRLGDRNRFPDSTDKAAFLQDA